MLPPAAILAALLAAPAWCAPAADADPFLHLEDDTSRDSRKWTLEHDAAARLALGARPGRAALRRELESAASSGTLSGLEVRGGRVFTLKRRGPDQHPVLTVRETPGSEPRVILDSAEGLDWWQPSADGLLLAYGVAVPGSADVELRVREVDSDLGLPDRISRTPGASLAWLPDRTGFYYTRLTAPALTSPGAAPYTRQVLLHRLGTDPALDPVAYSGHTLEEQPEVQVSRDGRLLLLTVWRGFDRSEVLVQDLHAPDSRPVSVTGGANSSYRGLLSGRTLYLLTDEGAPRGRILAVDLREPRRPKRRELVPEGPFTMTGLALAEGALAVSVLERGSARLRLHDLAGRPLREIPLPAQGRVSALTGSPGNRGVFFLWESFFVPPTLYRADARSGALAVFDSVPGPESEEFRLEVVEFPSWDRTPVTMFLASSRWRKRDGETPALLTALGCCGLNSGPSYSPEALAWMRQGGLWAVPLLRGGGESGSRWHEAGKRAAKKNTVADLIAAARWLVDGEYTRPGRLAASGRSHGALPAADALLEAPELFAAGILDRPLLDLRRYQQFPPGMLWVGEYGSAADPAQEPGLKALSPYSRVLEGRRLPPVLILAGPCPRGAAPAHGRKFTAAVEKNGGTALFRWEPLGCAELPLSRALDEALEAQAFLFWEMGLEKPVPPARPSGKTKKQSGP